eukprot:PhM_4_TR10426/c0_g1_i1/m.59186
MPLSIHIVNDKDVTDVVVKSADPQPPAGEDETNLTFEEAINEVSCAKRGDVIVVKDLSTDETLYGCLFKHQRTGVKGSMWYSEIMLVSALCTEDGRPGKTFSSCSVWTDHMERINMVKLVPNGCTFDDGDEELDPDVTAQSPTSPRARRRLQAYADLVENKQ